GTSAPAGIPAGAEVPSGGADVVDHYTIEGPKTSHTDYTTGANVRTVSMDYKEIFTYSYADMVSTTQEFADNWTFELSANGETKGKGGIIFAEAEVSVGVGLKVGAGVAWRDIDTKSLTTTFASAKQADWKAGQRAGYAPAGYLRQYTTVYYHKGGRTSTKNWTAFEVHSYEPHVFRNGDPPNLVTLKTVACRSESSC
uniref:hypothetical protein n=1 Tax=Streptomyces aureus TaxID=193461 RepID=UPI000AE4DFE3